MPAFHTILVDLIFITLHLLLLIFNYRVAHKKSFQPAVLFSLVWFVILVMHFVLRFTILNELFPLSVQANAIFFIGALSFSLGSFIVSVNTQKNMENISKSVVSSPDVSISIVLRIIYLAIILVGLPFYVQIAYKLVLASKIDDFFVGLRSELSYGEENFGILKYFLTFSFVVFGINLHAYFKDKNRLNFIIMISGLIISLIYSVFATGRSFYLMVLLIFAGISFLHNKNFSLKKVIWVLMFFVVFFMAVGIQYGKGGNKEDSIKENLQPSVELTAVYLVASLSALDYETSVNNNRSDDGSNTLRFFLLVAQQLNIFSNKKATELVQPFVYVSYPTNVYTYFSPYIRDFGKLYAWGMLIIFGAVQSWLYHKAVTKKGLRETMYFSFLLYPLVMSFFMDLYLTLMSTWVQVFVFVEVTIIIDKIIKKQTAII